MSKKTNKILWETTDYDGRIVLLGTNQLYHAVKGHPEVADLKDEAKKVIEKPDEVVQSKKFANTEVHGRYGICEGTLSNKWLHVAVLYQVGGVGDVLSIYTSPTPKQGDTLYKRKKT